MTKVTTTHLPPQSICRQYIAPVNYQDAYKVRLNHPDLSIAAIYLQVFAHSPRWINRLLAIRNRLAGLVRLNNYQAVKGQITRKDLKVGAKAGIFRIYAIKDSEIIAGDDDSHLDFRVSVLRQDDDVVISTLVKYNNRLGRIYMQLIMPFHKMVVKAMLKAAAKNNRI